MRHKKVEKRITQPDKIYNSPLVAKFINRVMLNGKKSIAEKNVYGAFEIIKKQDQNPLEVFEKAIQTVGPKVEVKARRVGGASYQVPMEVRSERRLSLAIRWLIEAAKKRSNKEFHTFEKKLSQELLDATQNLGEAVRKRDLMQKQAEANKAFANFRW